MEEIHLFTLVFVALVIVYSDVQAFLYVLGKKPMLSKERVHLEHKAVWVGLSIMIITGAVLLVDEGFFLLSDPAFLLKMVFVGALVLNARAVGSLIPLASEKTFAELPQAIRTKMLLSGAVSTSAWMGAAVIGLFFL